MSRGDEDRTRVSLTGAVCFERSLTLRSSRKKKQVDVGCCNDRTDERRPIVRPELRTAELRKGTSF